MQAPMTELTLRDIPDFPPPWSYASAGQPGERRGRMAARRAFVELKLSFTRAAALLPGSHGRELQTQVRQASEPIELWLLRTALLAALPDELVEVQRQEIELALDRVFPALAGLQNLPR